MGRVVSISASLLGAAAVAGCTTMTNFPTQGQFTVAEVADRIQCQLRNVANGLEDKYAGFKSRWSAGINLDLQVKRNASGSLKPFEWVIPSAAGDSAKLGASASGGETADRSLQTDYNFPLSRLDNLVCAGPPPIEESSPHPIREDLFQTFADYMAFVYGPNFLDQKKQDLVYKVTFTVEHSAEIGPTLGIVNLSGGATVGKGRTDTHVMTATFTWNERPIGQFEPLPAATESRLRKSSEKQQSLEVFRNLLVE